MTTRPIDAFIEIAAKAAKPIPKMKVYSFTVIDKRSITECPVKKGVMLGSIACTYCKYHGYTSHGLNLLACSRPGFWARMFNGLTARKGCRVGQRDVDAWRKSPSYQATFANVWDEKRYRK